MSFLEWSGRFRTGYPSIDAQHQSLFTLLDSLYDVVASGRIPQIQTRMLVRLSRSFLEHFADEESLMQIAGYPEFLLHKAEHLELSKSIREAVAKQASGTMILPVSLPKHLSEWLCRHILEEDLPMISWVQDRQGRMKAA